MVTLDQIVAVFDRLMAEVKKGPTQVGDYSYTAAGVPVLQFATTAMDIPGTGLAMHVHTPNRIKIRAWGVGTDITIAATGWSVPRLEYRLHLLTEMLGLTPHAEEES